jgi:glycosyltransferase involved in cell wall biosynthesis
MTESDLRLLAVTAHRSREVAEPLRQAAVDAEIVDVDGSNPFHERVGSTLWQTWRAIRTHDPDVVLLDCRDALGALVALLCLVFRIPLVFRFKGDYWRDLRELHRADDSDGLRPLVVYYLRLVAHEFVYAVAAGFVVVSTELAGVVAQRTDCPRDRIAVVHVPVEPAEPSGSASAARRRLGIEASTVVLTVTNLNYPGKYAGVETILDGLCPLLAANDDLAYVVAGDGPYHEALEQTIRELDTEPAIRPRIHAPGFVAQVWDLYALADVVVYVSGLDGYPNVVLEAQRAGLPVVANAAHGMVEQIDHGETGLLLDRPDPDCVTRQVTRLLADADERTRLGQNARESVLTENDPAEIGHQFRAALAPLAR